MLSQTERVITRILSSCTDVCALFLIYIKPICSVLIIKRYSKTLNSKVQDYLQARIYLERANNVVLRLFRPSGQGKVSRRHSSACIPKHERTRSVNARRIFVDDETAPTISAGVISKLNPNSASASKRTSKLTDRLGEQDG